MGNPDKRSFMPDYRCKIGQSPSPDGCAPWCTAWRLPDPQTSPAQGNQLRYLIRSLEHEGYNQIVNEVDLGKLWGSTIAGAHGRAPALFKPSMMNIALRDPI